MTEKLDHPVYETRFTHIASRYLKTYFVFEFLACAPILIYETIFRFTIDYDDVKKYHVDSLLYHIFFFMKIFKLLAAPKVAETFAMTVGALKDFFYMHRTLINGIHRMVHVILKTGLISHIMVCIWLRLSLYFDEQYFLESENSYDNLDIIELESKIMIYYTTQLYFIVTTVTTVGYGDYKPFTSVGRLYIMLVQFFGIIIFTEYQQAITSI